MCEQKLANPGPLGLMGFGMTTVLLNIHNAGFYPIVTAIVAMGIFCGGLSQVIAGILEFKKGNTFGMTAFTCYGFFWLSLVAIWYFPDTTTVVRTPATFLGIYLLIWGIFTSFMFIGTLKSNRATQLVFGTLAVLFFLLAIGNMIGSKGILNFAGYEGIICGSIAIYTAMAEVINEQFGKRILPLG